MRHPDDIKVKAILLRKKGKTYSDIQSIIPVTKSTLSLWLRDVGLSKPQIQKISDKKHRAQKRGGAIRKKQRQIKEKSIIEFGKNEIGSISLRELKLIGSALYWAEGAKAKKHNVSQGLDFGNSDIFMIQFYLLWLKNILKITEKEIHLSLYIHESQRMRIDKIKHYWEKQCGFHKGKISYVYFKKHTPKTNRRNLGLQYNGLLRIRVRKSTDLNRKVQGWILGIEEYCGNLS